MAVRVEKNFQVKEPLEKVWKLLSDPSSVATCVPGAKLTEKVDERTFKGSISVKIGPSVTDYKGEVRIERLDAEAHEIELAGKGLDTRGRGSASMKMTGRLRALPDGLTEVAAISEVNVVGALAQFGGRMIQDVSDYMFGEFVKRFQQQLQQVPNPGDPAPAAATPAPDGATSVMPLPPPPNAPIDGVNLMFRTIGAAVGRFLARIFGRARHA
jgi:uncharacterized protein